MHHHAPAELQGVPTGVKTGGTKQDVNLQNYMEVYVIPLNDMDGRTEVLKTPDIEPAFFAINNHI